MNNQSKRDKHAKKRRDNRTVRAGVGVRRNEDQLSDEPPQDGFSTMGEFQTAYRAKHFKARITPCGTRDMDVLLKPGVANVTRHLTRGVVVRI